MRTRRPLLALSLLAIALLVPSLGRAAPQTVDALLASMSLEEKVGQMMLVAF